MYWTVCCKEAEGAKSTGLGQETWVQPCFCQFLVLVVEAVVAVIVRQAWDLGPFAAELQYLHLDTPLLEQQNTKKLYVTKNNCVHPQLG